MNRTWTSYLPRVLRDRLHASPLLQKLISNTSWLFADRVLRMGVGLLVTVWFSRYLGPEQFGFYNYLIAIVALLAPLAPLGMDNIVIRELVVRPGETPEILGTAFVVRVIGGVGVLLGSIVAVNFLQPGDQTAITLVAIIAAGPLVQALDVTDLWFQSQTQASYTVIAKSAAFLSTSLIRIVLVLLQAPLLAFLWVGLVEVVVGTIGSVVAYWRIGMPLTRWHPSMAMMRRMFPSSWPLFISGVAIVIYMKIDVVMLNQMQGELATGVYSAALRMSEIWYFIPYVVVMSVGPTMMAVRQTDEALYYSRLSQMFVLMSRLSVGLALPITLLAYPMVLILFGEEYSGAAVVLGIHIWSAIFVFLGGAQSIWDVAEDLTILALFRTAGGAVINVGLNLVLIPAYAGVGAAIATAVAYAFSAWLLNALHPRTWPIFQMQSRALVSFPWRASHKPS